MAIQWAGLSPEILLRLDRRLDEPLGSQLQRELRDAIGSGRLSPGERLPSSRAVARQLGVSRGLVLECYAQLQAEGYLSTRIGSATRVAAGARMVPARPAPAAAPRPSVDFRLGVPDLASFPRRDWLWALDEASRGDAAATFGYGEARGSPALREVLVAYLRRVRGSVSEPDRVVISGGFAQGINLVLRALARAGVRRIALEDPGARDPYALAAWLGIEAVPVRVDRGGIDLAALAASDVRAVLLTPAHQYPTGVLLAPERRHALVAWAAERDATIIEDDYDAEFRYDRRPFEGLQGLAPDRVVALSSVSKTLAPALRLGWIVAPARLIEAIAHEKQLDDRGSPGLDQLALARLIESGRYDRHLRRMRAVYGDRRCALIDALAEHAPEVEASGLMAGLHAVLHLPDAADEAAIVAAARARSVGLYGMSGFRASGATRPPALVVGFAHLHEAAIARGIAAVADLLRAGARPARRRRVGR